METRIEKLMANPRRGLLILAAPAIVSMFFQTMLNFVDFIFVSGLGPGALAAVQLSFPVFFLLIAFCSGINIGATALISKRLGEKNKKWAEETALHAFLLAIIVAIIFTLVGVLFSEQLAAIQGASPELTKMAGSYIFILFACCSIFFLSFASTAILQAEGDTKTPMKIALVFTAVNIVLDPIFIYTLGMGIAGAAIATVIAEAVSVIILAYLFFVRKSTYLGIKPREFIYTPQIIKNILKVGAPAAVTQMMLSLAVGVVNLILSSFGDLPISAYGIGFRIDSFAILPVIGLSVGTIPMVGFYRGAKDCPNIKKVTKIAITLCIGFGLIVGLLIFLGADGIASVFTDDPSVIDMASGYLRIMAFSYPLMGITIILSSVFQGMGRGIPSLIIVFSRAVLVAVPLCYYLAHFTELGVTGVWIGITVSAFVAAILSLVWITSAFKKFEKACSSG
ncbi:MAG: MATE family efflux transporter [Candidatus Altiarchaeota archaeon]|nr:MATE family efflux transporter [Candidatus Altiarchaeota archaeon]